MKFIECERGTAPLIFLRSEDSMIKTLLSSQKIMGE